jgi:VIT1/CCC1 family predicted Fe2+/Mn2+ transporter
MGKTPQDFFANLLFARIFPILGFWNQIIQILVGVSPAITSNPMARLHKYLGEFVYGGIDGSVTTFAVVAGSAGAGLDSQIIIILGFANLIADGFSMSVGAYLSAKSEHDNFHKHRKREYQEIEETPELEREEVRQIYREKGFEGPLLEEVVRVITADKDRWVDVMMTDELGMLKDGRSPLAIGGMTYLSFMLMGLIPLLSYTWDFLSPFPADLFVSSCVLTGIAFIVVGALKSAVTETRPFRSIAETVLLGTSAAVLAYLAGDLLEKLFA